MSDKIQRWASMIASASIIAGAAWLTTEQRPRRSAESIDAGFGEGGAKEADAGTSVGTSAPEAGTPFEHGLALDMGDGGSSLTGLASADGGGAARSAPRAVRIGVVVVQFAGAEGAPSAARGKADALKHAASVALAARADFKAAARAGDPGSSEDIGRIPRGVLDRGVEQPIFELEPGDVSEPLETPRGYWIVKRID